MACRRTALSACVVLTLAVTADVLSAADETKVPSAEKWSSPNLKVTSGLDVWLDAAQQNAARKALDKAQLADGRQLDAWYDSSGHGRHVVQKQTGSQPTFAEADGHALVRFDGQDDYLQLSDLKAEYRDLTVVIVAAPFANQGQFRAFLAMNKVGVNDYVSGLTLDQGAWPSPRRCTRGACGAASARPAGRSASATAASGPPTTWTRRSGAPSTTPRSITRRRAARASRSVRCGSRASSPRSSSTSRARRR